MDAVATPQQIAARDSASPPATFSKERRGAARWRLRADHRDILLDGDAPDWFALEREPRARLVKMGQGRAVWTIRQGGQDYYVKVFEDRFLLKRWTASRSSEREWRASIKAEARGIPVITPIACAVRADRSVFISLAFSGAEPLSECWRRATTGSAATSRRTMRALWRSAARLMAMAHERGLSLRDNHANNILVARQGACDFEARFVDLIGASLSNRPLKDRPSALSLAALDQHFQRAATRTQRLAFLREYIAQRIGSDVSGEFVRLRIRALWPVLIDAGRRHGAIIARRRDRRLRGDGKYFTTLDLGGGWRALVALRIARRHVFPEPHAPDRSREEWVPILTGFIQGGADRIGAFGVAVEEFRTGPVACFGRRALCAFRDAHRRRHRDEPAPLKLAVIEHYSWGVRDFEALLVPASNNTQ